METYIINGQEFEYDTFDLENMEVYDREIRRVAEAARAVDRKGLNENNYISAIRARCMDVRDAFDIILGDGSADRIFGGRVNAKEILMTYQQFVMDVNQTRASLAQAIPTNAQPAGNRAQRREADRARRNQ